MENSSISQLVSTLKGVDNYETDMKIEFDGWHHGRKGFRLIVSQMDHISDSMVSQWKDIIKKHGYSSHVSYDCDHGWANITCKKDQVRGIPFLFYVYLSISMTCIYAWSQY